MKTIKDCEGRKIKEIEFSGKDFSFKVSIGTCEECESYFLVPEKLLTEELLCAGCMADGYLEDYYNPFELFIITILEEIRFL